MAKINEEYLKEKLPNLSDATIKIYASNLKTLNDGIEPKNLKFLDNTEEIFNKIKKYKISTQRNYIACVLSVLKSHPRKQSMYATYTKLFNDMKQELDETQKEKMTNLEIPKFDEIKLKFEELLKKNGLNRNTLIVSFYIYQEPRRNLDYAKLLFNPFNEETTENYYDGMYFVFQKYKTAKTYGQQKVKVNDCLRILLNKYLDENNIQPNEVFIDIQPYNITKILDKTIGYSVGELRKIFLSSTYSQSKQELDEHCEKMGTSSNTAKLFYIK